MNSLKTWIALAAIALLLTACGGGNSNSLPAPSQVVYTPVTSVANTAPAPVTSAPVTVAPTAPAPAPSSPAPVPVAPPIAVAPTRKDPVLPPGYAVGDVSDEGNGFYGPIDPASMTLRDWAYYQQKNLGQFAGRLFSRNPNPFIPSLAGDVANAWDGGANQPLLIELAGQT